LHRWRPREGGRGEGGGPTDIKSNKPHLTGGEKWVWNTRKVAIIWDEKCDTNGIIMGNMDLAIKEIVISPSGVVISP